MSPRQPRRFPGDDGRTGTRAGDRGVEHVTRAVDEWRWPIVIAWGLGIAGYLAARALDVPISIPELGIGGGTLTVGTALVLAFRVVRLVKGWSGVERQVGAVAVGQEALSTALEQRLDLVIAHLLGPEAVAEVQAVERAGRSKGRRREDTAQADAVTEG